MKIILPNQNVPVLNPDGTMQRDWYEKLSQLASRGLSDLPDVDKSSLANGDSPVWNATTNRFEFIAN